MPANACRPQRACWHASMADYALSADPAWACVRRRSGFFRSEDNPRRTIEERAAPSFALDRKTNMPHLTTDDDVKLYYEETGAGIPVVFVHEFAGDCRSREPQVRHFGKAYRCITFNARGYSPSDVPADGD